VSHSIAVIGGGINGAGIAWELTRKGYRVSLFERGALGAATSSATTKLIHGGVRYLEHFDFRLVYESLHERAFLLENVPELVHPIEIILPVYNDSPRPPRILGLGLTLYDWLAGRDNIAPHRPVSIAEMVAAAPLRRAGLVGGFSYWDAQVDDHRLVQVVGASARRDGAVVREFTPVTTVMPADRKRRWIVSVGAGDEQEFDMVVNAVGPWMNDLLSANHLPTRYRLTLIRGSHLVLRRRVSDTGFLLQSTVDRRIFFVLPWKGTTMVGTTEVHHTSSLDHIEPSGAEIDYLMERFNHYFETPIGSPDVERTFAGVRPLIGQAGDPDFITREYRIETRGTMINVFGGKMTTFLALARRVGDAVDDAFGETHPAEPPVFALESS
jgi:glycerol-3-phosphate dehydrogenase